MEAIYFSKENFKRIYKILYTNFKKKYNFSIKRRPEYKQKIIDIMKFVYSQRSTYDIPPDLSEEHKSIYLTQKLINVMLFYESKNHPDETESSDPILEGSSGTTFTDIRPKVVSNKAINNNIENSLSDLLESRKPVTQEIKEIDFSVSDNNFNNVNVQDRYSQITKQRETEYDNFTLSIPGVSEMKQGDKNLFETMNMTPDNVDLDNVLGDYQILNNANNDEIIKSNLQSHYPNERNNNIIESSESASKSNPLETNITDVANRIIIKTTQDKDEKKEDTSYIRYQTLVIACGMQGNTSKKRVIEFKDVTTASDNDRALENTNGGGLIRDGWANVISAEITRVMLTPQKADQAFMLVTTETLPTSITQSGNLPQDLFAILYHDNSSTNFSHYINMDEHLQEFEKPTQAFTNRVTFNIKMEDGAIYSGECKLFINIGIRIDHKFDK